MKKLMCMLLAMVMVLAMAACGDENKKLYDEAVDAYQSGNYEEAANKLAELGEYEDSAELLATICAEKAGATVEVTTPAGTVTTEVEYIFKNGSLVKETVTHADGAVTKNYYKYDEDGLCSSETLNELEGGKVVINHFYENGSKIRTVRTNADKTKDTYRFTCDESGKILSHELTYADGTVEEATYSYNEAGQLAVISTATGNTTYEYNAFGDLVKETVTANEEVVFASTYTYVYTYIVG